MKKKIKKFLGECYPPGYEYRQEWIAVVILLGIGTLLSFSFFSNLQSAYWELYVYNERHLSKGSAWVLKEGVVAAPFIKLAWGVAAFFAPLFLFLALMAIYHYLYYRRYTKSIYLMRRLPSCGVIAKSCILGPLLCMAAGTAFVTVLYLLYYLIYLLVIPAQCLPRWA